MRIGPNWCLRNADWASTGASPPPVLPEKRRKEPWSTPHLKKNLSTIIKQSDQKSGAMLSDLCNTMCLIYSNRATSHPPHTHTHSGWHDGKPWSSTRVSELFSRLARPAVSLPSECQYQRRFQLELNGSEHAARIKAKRHFIHYTLIHGPRKHRHATCRVTCGVTWQGSRRLPYLRCRNSPLIKRGVETVTMGMQLVMVWYRCVRVGICFQVVMTCVFEGNW